MIKKSIQEFLRLESASGILLIIAAILAMLAENSPAKPLYDALLSTPVEIRLGALHIAKPLLLWVNDGLMAVFFFLVGLELKREMLQGELSNREQIILPAVGAFAGMVCPALIYMYFNFSDPVAMRGWAIPSATDIAFALGVLSLLGDRVPTPLKLFLLTLAIIDDLGAIIIIALFYTSNLSLASLLFALACLAVLFILNKRRVYALTPYIVVGMILWISVLKSGVHATLAGVILAFFIPLKTGDENFSPLKNLEHDLHPTVAFFILPVFAFANTGVSLSGLGMESILSPVPMGIAAGLFLGNQIGIFVLCWLTVKLGFARLPDSVNWAQLYGTGVLCGIGFTMSLFISSLAFEAGAIDYAVDDRLGILLGSILSAITGWYILHRSLPKAAVND